MITEERYLHDDLVLGGFQLADHTEGGSMELI